MRIAALIAFFLAAPAGGAAAAGTDAGAAPELLVDMTRAPVPDAGVAPAAVARDVFGEGAGEIAMTGKVEGRFTSPAHAQTLYVLQRGGPDATNPQGQEAVLAVYEGDRLVAKAATHLGNFVAAKADVDGDGLDEVLLRTDSFQMGEAVTGLSLVGLAGGKLTERRRFEQAADDRCGAGGAIEADVIRYRRGRPPQFDVQHVKQACPADGTGH